MRLEPELRQALDERAAQEETTPAEIVREALRRFLKVT
ncbi:MAG: ribbon-helix-helix protein, CopG family [Acidimicrobiia bacterium]